jgi:hypothetical protein
VWPTAFPALSCTSEEDWRNGEECNPVAKVPSIRGGPKWDCLLVCEDGSQIPANRRDLIAISPVFTKMLRGFFRESFEDTILIRNIEGEILRNIIQSHYTHQANPISFYYLLRCP